MATLVSRRAAMVLVRLLRLPLAAMVALSGVVAAHLAGPAPALFALAALGWGLLLLTAAASVLNQVLERRYDALVPRTCHRPLATAQIPAVCGYHLGLLLALFGGLLLYGAGGLVVTTLGGGALFWYLLVYTPLKRISPLAVLCGTPCGALPILIGWLVGGGQLPAPQPLALVLVLVLWQVPHFWLLALPEKASLQAAGYRVLPEPLSERRLLALCHRWLLGLALASLLLPALDMVGGWSAVLVIGVAGALAAGSTLLLQRSLFPQQAAARLRMVLSAYLLTLLLLLLVGARG